MPDSVLKVADAFSNLILIITSAVEATSLILEKEKLASLEGLTNSSTVVQILEQDLNTKPV